MRQLNNYTGEDLTFVVCAYKECPYLEKCVDSLVNQTVRSHIIISTSTPNDHILNVAKKYGLEVRINPDGGQIGDYNFAMKQAETELVMLAHQDEVLMESFAEEVISGLNQVKDPIIAFTDYIEIHNDLADKKQSGIIKVKKLMLIPARWKWFMGTRFGKRFIQLMGNPITHPTVVCVQDKMPEEAFRENYKAAMDWDLWERLSRVNGSFVYINKILLCHRMNDSNQTSLLLKTTNDRFDNEYEIFCRFWPGFIARLLMHFYRKAYKYY